MAETGADSGPISSIVIVGGGTAGWMSAALLARLFGKTFAITLIESDEIGAIGVGEATIPGIKHYNRLVGIDETAFLKATGGTYKLGIEFVDWTRLGDRYMHGFGYFGQNLGWLRLHQYWLKALKAGRAAPLGDYSINTMAAYANRFSPARADMPQSPLGQIQHAYHFDATLYARFLRAMAEDLGVRRIEGKITEVVLDPQKGHVSGVRLESGAVHGGDLFIDCSGQRALLIGEALKVPFDDWSDYLFCNSALAQPCASVSPLTPYTRSTARTGGWIWRIPLQHRIGNGMVYSSEHISDDEAAAQLKDALDGEALAAPRLIRFRIGKRRRIFEKNVVAVGLSSGFLEPLESTSIHLIQSMLLKLVNFFPDRRFAPADADAFNQQADFEYERIRDFIIAHYKLTERDDTPFWRANRDMRVPETLKAKLDLFAASGRVFRENEELFAEESWIQVLIGQGLVPHGYDAAVDIKGEDEIFGYLDNVRKVIGACVETLPDHADYIRRNCAADIAR